MTDLKVRDVLCSVVANTKIAFYQDDDENELCCEKLSFDTYNELNKYVDWDMLCISVKNDTLILKITKDINEYYWNKVKGERINNGKNNNT